MIRRTCPLFAILILVTAMAGCRGTTSTEPPIHPNPNMDQQDRFDPQEPSTFWPDGRSMRPEVPGTVAHGMLKDDDHYYQGKIGEEYATTMPSSIVVDRKLLDRGRDRFQIYCMPCHDAAGTGQGIVAKRGFIPPPSFMMDRLVEMPIGQIVNLIGNGVRNMPAYGAQIPIEDRWAIAAYVRALQLAGGASLDKVPADIAAAKGWTP